MKLEHEFTVPAAIDEAWKVLLDVERVAPCMPGATLLTVDDQEFTGTVKVKVGPIQVTYKGQARFSERDETGYRAVIEASGKESRGSGTAAATVTTVLEAVGDSQTRVKVETDLNVTGRPAQFGRGVMAEVGGKLIEQFSRCLADELGSPATPAPPSPTTETATAPLVPPTSAAPTEAAPGPATPRPQVSSGPRQVPPPAREAEAIDLLDVAGASIVKRLVPVGVVAALLLLLIWRRRRK
jgi:carbon monoxide dehydrogenase subunit G